MKTCLLIADRHEHTADLLIAELRRRNVPCVRWNLDQYPVGSSLTYRDGQTGLETEILSDGRVLDLQDVGSIWCRNLEPAGLSQSLEDFDQRFSRIEAQRTLTALVTIGECLWINHPHHNLRANSKPAQLHIARRVGLDIPPTLITNNPAEVRAFFDAANREIVYKALSQSLDAGPGKALFTGLVTRRELAELDLIGSCPGIFQTRIPKSFELRITVVGTRIFPAKIESQRDAATELDWRHAPFEVADDEVQLPRSLEQKILTVMQAFELNYGAFDFIVTPDGRYVFLEVNPAGQYMWVETATGLPITAGLVDLLAAACRI